MTTQTLDRPTTGTGLEVRPYGPTIGAEIGGIDLGQPLDKATREELYALLLKHKVLFFRDQAIDRDQQLAFARNFGELYAHPSGGLQSHRIIQPIASEDFKKYADRGNHWHTDTSWRLNPSLGAVLRAVDIPETGGDTIWADGGAILRGLPDDLRAAIDDAYVIHDFQDALAKAGEIYPLVAHPLIRTHPETGEDILWVNFSLKPRIVDLAPEDSKALLARVYDEIKKPEYHARFRWAKNSVAFWDNRAGVHYAVRDYGDYPRVMERVLIASDDVPHRVRKAA
ncbi:TauD/TfdA dioxygenase family protein [Glacieibacterium sp.]|uniref:TauD/TfdA dioxygenase family protein n=1 Tax=Glacieibacterium sp. TaxID=2860237 RepID=UPI003B000E50